MKVLKPSKTYESTDIKSKKTLKLYISKYWWAIALLVVLAIYIFMFIQSQKVEKTDTKNNKETAALEAKKQLENADPYKINYPTCPANVSGILTSPIVETKYIRAIRPNGAFNPPGHTSPVDHATFMTDYTGKIPIYSPADGWIDRVITVSWMENGKYIPSGFRIYETICDGLIISAGGYKEFMFENELDKTKATCQEGINKSNEGTSANCDYKFNKAVKAGDLIGYTSLDENGTIPFEWWANNYNQTPRADVNWSYYNDGSQYATCLFDLYSGSLKTDYYKLLGHFDTQNGFVPRTIKPYCGEINQNIVGTIQGMWFGGPPSESQEMSGAGIAFIHDEFDPSKVVLSIGGNIASGQRNIAWISPKTSGTIDRDPSAITADGKIYCYDLENSIRTSDWKGKVITQLVDNTHLLVEKGSGACLASENFSNPFNFER